MIYKIFIPKSVQIKLEKYINYILEVFKSKQSAKNLILDYKQTIEILSRNAESYPLLEDEDLKKKNLRRIPFKKHRYVIIFHIVGQDIVYIDAIYHMLQDYLNLLK